MVTSALGRQSNFSGRTDIWRACLNAADSPIFGTGFESFWNVNVDKVARGLLGYWEIHNLVSAHNGYIQIYLDLGLVGLFLIVLILISGYWRASRAFYRNRSLGGLMLAYIVTAGFYSITEAGFRTMCPEWIFLLLAVISASGVATGLIGGENRQMRVSIAAKGVQRMQSTDFSPETETAYANRPVFGQSIRG